MTSSGSPAQGDAVRSSPRVAVPDHSLGGGSQPVATRLAHHFEATFGAGGTQTGGAATAHQRTFRVLVFGLFFFYMAVAIGFYLWRGVFFKPDQWALLLLIGALLLGRAASFLRDWIPFVLLIFGYEVLRGIAGSLVVGGREVRDVERADMPAVHLEELMRFDRTLFAGNEPLVVLQGWLYDEGSVHWYDYFATIMYSLHFVLPLILAFVFWTTRKDRFWLFTLTFCFMTYAAFAFFLLYPAAPPWLAQIWGSIDGLTLPQDQVAAVVTRSGERTGETLTIWADLSPHPVAAMPSLHASFPWLVMLFAIRFYGWWGLLFLPYNMALWFAVMYTANHWVVDILAGIAWATISFAVVDLGWNAITTAGKGGGRSRPFSALLKQGRRAA
ncbi:MAG: phosphatase PAP2 family protein [Chloroflexia bacterium]|nr:phosphatase PAP2 family protein [Chloroflexia bacterium]